MCIDLQEFVYALDLNKFHVQIIAIYLEFELFNQICYTILLIQTEFEIVIS